MSLAEAVTEIAEMMEKQAEELGCSAAYPPAKSVLEGYAKTLRLALKAASGATDQLLDTPARRHALSPEATARRQQNRADVEQARRHVEKKLAGEDAVGVRMVPCVGGAADGTFYSVAGPMPDGGRTAVAGQVYRVVGGKLHYDAEETKRLAGNLG